MPFANPTEAEIRLNDRRPLTEEEMEDLLEHANRIGGGQTNRLQAELALKIMKAIKRFDEGSTTINKRLYWLTWAIAIMTLVMTISTGVIVWQQVCPPR